MLFEMEGGPPPNEWTAPPLDAVLQLNVRLVIGEPPERVEKEQNPPPPLDALLPVMEQSVWDDSRALVFPPISSPCPL